jgi:hypothetical protein
MAASPGRSVQSFQKREFEIRYINRLREIPVVELLGLLAYESASKISKLAEEDLKFSDSVESSFEEIKYNTAVYEDDVEDYIYNESMDKIIAISRNIGDHESAENVRILRSARAVIYFTLKERGDDGV